MVVSSQTVSKRTRNLDEVVRQFHQSRLEDNYAYLFFGRSELAGAATDGAQAGADAGGLWSRRDGYESNLDGMATKNYLCRFFATGVFRWQKKMKNLFNHVPFEKLLF